MEYYEHNNQDITVTEEGESLFVFNLLNGNVTELNSIGKVIWTNIPGKNVSEIVDLIVGKYNVDRKEVNEDVQEFICELSNKGLIVQKQIGPHENNSFI